MILTILDEEKRVISPRGPWSASSIRGMLYINRSVTYGPVSLTVNTVSASVQCWPQGS